jgi:hypothetical protein
MTFPDSLSILHDMTENIWYVKAISSTIYGVFGYDMEKITKKIWH